MTLNISTLQAELAAINTAVTQLENVVSLIPFLPPSFLAVVSEIKLVQAAAPIIIADVSDIIAKVEALYAASTVTPAA